MERERIVRFVIPAVVGIILLVSFIILLGLASGNPDGFEWVLFDHAEVPEPEGGFEGIWSFLGEGPLVDVFTGAIGIIIVLVAGYALFWITSRKTKAGST